MSSYMAESIKKTKEEKEEVKVEEKEEVKVDEKAVTNKSEPKKDTKLVLKNVLGEEVEEKDYFFGGKAPVFFEKICGSPVEREDMIEVFNKIFNPKDNILFYKSFNKEVYLVIIPLKYSSCIGEEHESIEGDFQKHAISFIGEGSVNLDTLKEKLKRIVPFIKYTDR